MLFLLIVHAQRDIYKLAHANVRIELNLNWIDLSNVEMRIIIQCFIWRENHLLDLIGSDNNNDDKK